MKKTISVIILAVITGLLMSKLIFNEYDYKETIISVFSPANDIYFLEQGSYSTLDKMKENMLTIGNYIYRYDNDKYYAYIGLTTSKENAEKIKGYYKNKGYDIYIRTFNISNKEYISILKQYDEVLANITDEESINEIIKQTLKKYEEMVLSES